MIQGKQYFVLREEYLSRWQLDTSKSSADFFVHIGNDSVIILTTDTTSYSYPEVTLYKKATIQKAFSSDENIRDKYATLVLLFSNGSSWYLRALNGNTPLKRNYLGKEIIFVPAGSFECYKIGWDFNIWPSKE